MRDGQASRPACFAMACAAPGFREADRCQTSCVARIARAGVPHRGFELQCETFRVMKVGLARRMSERPIRKRSVESFDHRRNSDTQLNFSLEFGKAIQVYG